MSDHDELRAKIAAHESERLEYRRSWLEWLEANDGLEIREWLLAYSDATPEPSDSDEAETICGFIDRKMIAAAAEIERLRKERDDLVKVLESLGWDWFVDPSARKDSRTISGIPTESPRIDPKRE